MGESLSEKSTSTRNGFAATKQLLTLLEHLILIVLIFCQWFGVLGRWWSEWTSSTKSSTDVLKFLPMRLSGQYHNPNSFCLNDSKPDIYQADLIHCTTISWSCWSVLYMNHNTVGIKSVMSKGWRRMICRRTTASFFAQHSQSTESSQGFTYT